MFYPEGFANFALEKSFVPKVTFFFVYEHGKLGISVNTSPIMALVKPIFKGNFKKITKYFMIPID